jgi:ribosomal protein S18 acetylase RimI-like enzyme
MAPQIRDAVPTDADAIRQVQRLTWLATYPNEAFGITRADIEAFFVERTPAARQRGAARRRAINTSPRRHLWVADSGTGVVGMCLARKEGEVRHIQALYVLPDFQGQGIGRRLLQRALEWLGADRPVTLSVATYNSRAIAFYERLGFAPSGNPSPLPPPPLPSGVVIPDIEMIKR